jgi:hypothetical protein
MKMKTMITKIAVAGGFLAGASAALANATLTASSGSQNFGILGGQYGATTLSASFTDGWTVSVSTADVAGGSPTTIDLDQSASGTTIAPLTITFTDGVFGNSGPAVFSATGSASSDLSISVAFYGSSVALLPTTLTPILTSAGVSQYGTLISGVIPSALGTYTEVLTITPTRDVAQQISLDTGLTIVPDGGATLALLGSAFVGLAGIRSKFGVKA